MEKIRTLAKQGRRYFFITSLSIAVESYLKQYEKEHGRMCPWSRKTRRAPGVPR